MPRFLCATWCAVILGIAMSLPVLPCDIICAKPSCECLSCPDLDYGEVIKGEILRPCALIENKSSFSVTIQQVLPPICGGPYSTFAPFAICLQPHEKKIISLMQVWTAGLDGPIHKTYSFEVTYGAVLHIELFKTYDDAARAMENADA